MLWMSRMKLRLVRVRRKTTSDDSHLAEAREHTKQLLQFEEKQPHEGAAVSFRSQKKQPSGSQASRSANRDQDIVR